MIDLFALFWIFVILFALIGAMRGWSKEVIAMAGLVLSLFTINTFGHLLVRLLGDVGGGPDPADFMTEMRRQFLVLGGIHLLIAFFSYHGVAFVGSRLPAENGFRSDCWASFSVRQTGTFWWVHCGRYWSTGLRRMDGSGCHLNFPTLLIRSLSGP